MALTIGDNFSYMGAKPLDGRLKYDTVASMKAMADSVLYDGCLAYCVATGKTYQWKSTNEVDATLGRWREFESSGQGGHSILDNGTAMAQEEALNFTDFDISDDSTNSETDIKAHRLTAAELAEACSPLPQKKVDMPILFDERGIERIIGYYVLSDGTKKPVYEKTVDCGALPNNNHKDVSHNSSNVEHIISIQGIGFASSGIDSVPIPYDTGNGSQSGIGVYAHETYVRIITTRDFSTFNNSYVTIRYTKTTDTPE